MTQTEGIANEGETGREHLHNPGMRFSTISEVAKGEVPRKKSALSSTVDEAVVEGEAIRPTVRP